MIRIVFLLEDVGSRVGRTRCVLRRIPFGNVRFLPAVTGGGGGGGGSGAGGGGGAGTGIAAGAGTGTTPPIFLIVIFLRESEGIPLK